jgi:hypothetical protein
MTPITPEAFARLLRQADRDDVERVAAALFAADDGAPPVAVVDAPDEDLPAVDRDAGREPTVVLRGEADEDLRERARGRGLRLVDAAQLRERLLYGVEPERADELCEAHLGRPARLDARADPDPDYRAVPTATVARGRGARPGDGGDGRGRAATDEAGDDRATDGGRPGLAAGGGFAVGVVVAVVLAAALGGPVVGDVGSPSFGVGTERTPAPTATDGTATPTATAADPVTSSPTPDPDAAGGAPAGTTVVDVAVPPEFNASTANVTEPAYLRLRPTCERPPSLVVAIQLGALRNNDATDAGIRTVFAFASPRNRRFTGPFEGFREIVTSPTYAPLVNHSRADYGPVELRDGIATQRVTVYDANGTATTYDFALRRQPGGRYDGCWMNEGVSPVSTAE